MNNKKLNIKAICAIEKISYAEFAERIGTNKQRVAQMALGKAPMYAKDLVAIHEAFGIDYDLIDFERAE